MLDKRFFGLHELAGRFLAQIWAIIEIITEKFKNNSEIIPRLELRKRLGTLIENAQPFYESLNNQMV